MNTALRLLLAVGVVTAFTIGLLLPDRPLWQPDPHGYTQCNPVNAPELCNHPTRQETP